MFRTRLLIFVVAAALAVAGSTGTALARKDPAVKAERQCVREIIRELRDDGQKPRTVARAEGFTKMRDFKDFIADTICTVPELPPGH